MTDPVVLHWEIWLFGLHKKKGNGFGGGGGTHSKSDNSLLFTVLIIKSFNILKEIIP